jgi:hypothetical protein
MFATKLWAGIVSIVVWQSVRPATARGLLVATERSVESHELEQVIVTDAPPNGIGPNAAVGRTWRGWFGAEYLLWDLDGSDLPPLVTAGSTGTPRSDVAQLDQADTVVLSGGETIHDDWRSGYRLFGGLWLDCGQTLALSGEYFDAGGDDYHFVSPQDASQIIGRPFFNTETGEDDTQLISVPNELDGTVEVDAYDSFRGAGLLLHRSVWRSCDCCGIENRTEAWLVAGYRYYEYGSSLSISERLTVLPATMTPLVPGTTFELRDSFRTTNEFHGGEFGGQIVWRRGRWWLDGLAKLALGSNRRTVIIKGSTLIDVPGGGSFAADGGLYTSELTNIGRYRDSEFAAIPQIRLGWGANLSRNLAVRCGYNVVYWGDVVRAADHLPPGIGVDPRNVPPTLAGGGSEPIFPGILGSPLVAHGFDAGIVWAW